jgi:PKD repeat protein
MIADGYLSEGYGPDGTAFCVPTSPSARISSMQLTPDTFEFSALATPSADAQIIAYAWDFGDGSSGTGPTTPHQYAMPGAHTVVLAVTDSNDTIAKAVKTVATTPTAATLAALPANTAVELGPYTCSDVQGESAGVCRNVTDYSSLVYDEKRKQTVVFGGGHVATNYDAVNAFSSVTLQWVEQYPPTPATAMTVANYDYDRGAWLSGPDGGPYPRAAARHTEDLMNIVGDELIVLGYVEGNAAGTSAGGSNVLQFLSNARVAHYDLVAKTWTFSTAVGVQHWPASAYDPVSGKIVILGSYMLAVYDPAARAMTTALDFTDPAGLAHITREDGSRSPVNLGYNNNLVYFPTNQKMYYFERTTGAVYEVDLNRADLSASAITLLSTTGTPPPNSEIGYGYDPVNQIIGGGPINGVFYAFDPATKTWTAQTMQGGAPGSVAFHALNYDLVNKVFIFITDRASGRKTWAYRYR